MLVRSGIRGREGKGNAGMMAGPNWHPVLTESFCVQEGKMRSRVGGRVFFFGPGEGVTVRPEV